MAPRPLRTGVGGVAAFAASLIGFQVWGGILYGLAVMIVGDWANDVEDSFAGYGASSYDPGGSGNGLILGGVVIGIVSLGLLIALVKLLSGRSGGKVAVILLECLFLLALVAVAANSGTGEVLIGAIIPIAVIICLAATSTSRMFEDAEMGWVSPNP